MPAQIWERTEDEKARNIHRLKCKKLIQKTFFFFPYDWKDSFEMK